MNPAVTDTRRWTLGLWTIYFALKVWLAWQGTLKFDPLYNFALLLWVSFPVASRWVNFARHSIGVVLALLLLHHDSFLPPLERLTSQWHLLVQFDWRYLIALVHDSISSEMLLLMAVLIGGYLYLNQILRLATFVVAAMLFTALPKHWLEPAQLTRAEPVANATFAQQNSSEPSLQPSEIIDTSNSGLNRYLTQFFTEEKQRHSTLSQVSIQQPNFDVLFLNVCSLAWDDLDFTGQRNHPIWQQFDILFEHFNSATSYSGPAVLRILRANCGQQTHSELFDDSLNQQCSLFDQLAKLGFRKQVLMNHDGKFDGFNKHIASNIGPFTPAVNIEELAPAQYAFDGTKIYRDSEVLNQWLANWQQQTDHTVSLYNTISIHDGNRVIGKQGSRLQTYRRQQKVLLDDLNAFFQHLEQSGRNVVVILLPEHGASVRGDRIQVSGMREIPTQAITSIPVGVKFFGQTQFIDRQPIKVEQPSSYLAISDLLSNVLLDGVYQGKTMPLERLVTNLPTTPIVSQNSGTTMMTLGGKQYYSFDDGKTWSEYQP